MDIVNLFVLAFHNNSAFLASLNYSMLANNYMFTVIL